MPNLPHKDSGHAKIFGFAGAARLAGWLPHDVLIPRGRLSPFGDGHLLSSCQFPPSHLQGEHVALLIRLSHKLCRSQFCLKPKQSPPDILKDSPKRITLR
jgi:hypothetical protein